jgi:predicted dehydrogenase
MSGSPTLGVGIIGCGQVTQTIHLPTLYSLPELFRVVHLVDASSSVVARVAPGMNVRRGTDHLALLDDPNVDVVLVATPDAYHARHAVDACRAGKKAVLVEKPLALTPGEAQAVADESARTGVPVQVGTMHVYDPAFRAALPYMEGTPDLVLVEAILGPNDFNRDDAIQFVRGRPDVDDGEAPLGYIASTLRLAGIDAPAEMTFVAPQVLGLSSHDFAPLRAVLGEPSRVEHVSISRGAGYTITLDYGGPKAIITVYWHRTRLHSWKLRWLTPDRQVEVRYPQSWGMSLPSEASVYELRDGQLHEQRIGNKYETGFREEWRHLHAVASGDAQPLTLASDAAADVRLSERIINRAAGKPKRAADAIGVLILGAGNITATHAAIIDALPAAKVTGVVSRTMRSAERRAWRYECPALTFDDLESALALPGTDVVLVAGPPSVHLTHTAAALAAGKHVIVEKPLCSTLAEADELCAVGDRSAGRVAYAENYHFLPVLQAAASAIANEAIGDVRSFRVYTLHTRPAHGDFLRPEWGGGALFDLGAHTIWWALMLAGFLRVDGVTCALESRTPDEGDDYARLTLHLEGGVEAEVEVSWRETSASSGAVVDGQHGRLEMAVAPRSHVTVTSVEGVVSPVEISMGPRTAGAGYITKFGYRPQIEHFLDAFRRGEQPYPGVKEAALIMDITAAAYASARSGGRVSLPFAGDRTRTPYQLWRG